MKKLNKSYSRGNIAIVVLIVAILVVIGLVIFRQLKQDKKQVKTITVNKQVIVKRSKAPEIIERGLTGKAIDVNTGRIVTAARIFSLDDKTVYLELDLNSPPKGTLVDYIRYKNGRYVDHGEVSVVKSDTKNLLFNWTINKLVAGVHEGKWKIATYTNGILEKRIAYDVTKNGVSEVTPEEVRPSDSDYYLSTVLARAK